MPSFPTRALGILAGCQHNTTQNKKTMGASDCHPPDCFSSRTGASARLQRLGWGWGEEGQKSEARKRGAPLPPRSRDTLSLSLGGRGLSPPAPGPRPLLTTQLGRKRRATRGGGPGGGHASPRPQAWSAPCRTSRDRGAWWTGLVPPSERRGGA